MKKCLLNSKICALGPQGSKENFSVVKGKKCTPTKKVKEMEKITENHQKIKMPTFKYIFCFKDR